MPIYSLNERVKYFKDVIDVRGGENKVSFASGNLFESLATTNPELFNMQKLKELEFSRNLVADFNTYFGNSIDAENKRYNDFLESIKDLSEEEYVEKYGDGYFGKYFNILYHSTFYNDIEYLAKELGSRDKAIAFAIYNMFPESLSEEGIKSLIRVRMINHQILIDGLTEMLKSNYKLLDIETAEAKVMMDKLHNDAKSHEAIGDIRNKLLDTNTINKFKDGNNYDFRPIGGAYVILGKHIDFEGANPAKYMIDLFKYDCIVISHGSYWPKERTRSILKAALTRGEYIVAKFKKLFDNMMNDTEFTKALTDKYRKLLVDKYNEINKYSKKKFLNSDETKEANNKMLELIDILIDMVNDDSIPWDDKDEILRYASTFDYIMQSLQAKYNIIQNKIDGKSSEWIVRPVNTLKQKNLTHMIDILRALKAEGFKNISVHSCNPGSVKLPIDLRMSLNFQITMGKHSVYIEDAILQEGIIDSFKDIIKKTKDIITNTKNSCSKFFSELKKKTSDLISNRFKNYKKFDNPVKLNLIAINKNKCSFEEVLCNNPEDIKKHVESMNKSIIEEINRLNDDQKKYIEKIKEPENIFEGVKFI